MGQTYRSPTGRFVLRGLVKQNPRLSMKSKRYTMTMPYHAPQLPSYLKCKCVISQLLKSSFSDFDLARMPSKVSELRADPPTAWNTNIEQALLRSMTFSEFEMLSQPTVILNVASSTDTDPVRCMQELSFVHHTPACISSVQHVHF